MPRRLVLVEIDADSPLSAEMLVGRALQLHAPERRPFTRQTQVIVAGLP